MKSSHILGPVEIRTKERIGHLNEKWTGFFSFDGESNWENSIGLSGKTSRGLLRKISKYLCEKKIDKYVSVRIFAPGESTPQHLSYSEKKWRHLNVEIQFI